jgi:hypothetical protein
LHTLYFDGFFDDGTRNLIFLLLKLVVRSRLRRNYWLVDRWYLRLLGLGLVRLLVFLARQLVDGLLEDLVDLGKDILRYLLKVLNLLFLGLHLFV